MIRVKNQKVLCLGEVLWDMLPSGPVAGGAPMNVAIHMKKFGLDVSMASKVGEDQSGKALVDFIQQAGLDLELIQHDAVLPTSKVLVHLDQNNNATYEICHPVAWDNIQLTNQLKAIGVEAGLIIFGTLASRDAETRKTVLDLLENNCLKLVDINLRQPYDQKDVVETMLHKADIAKLNDEELVVISQWHNKHKHDEKSIISWLAETYQLETIIVTRGDKGAIAYHQNRFYDHPGYVVSAVDTVGSGDAFLAGFVASLFEDKPIPDALAFACATGALVATKRGGTPLYETSEIYDIMQCNK